MKICTRLGAGFGLVLLLAIIVGVSYTRLNDLSGDIEEITRDRMVKVQMANDIMENTLIMARAARNL
jgi:CHASE3 domain sensor protein